MSIILRAATPADAPALLAIYAPYVLETAVTFEYTPPTAEAFAQRIRQTLARYPYLAAQEGEAILGYAYAGPFHTRAAYAWAAESSVYVRREGRRQGVGRRLYQALEEALRAQGVTNLYACLAYPCAEGDPHLTRDSEAFHQRLGFAAVGRFHRCGYKFDAWYDMIWMEKEIAPHRVPQPPFRPFPLLREALGYGA